MGQQNLRMLHYGIAQINHPHKEDEMQSKKEMPLEHKPILTIREASFYTGISEKKLIEICRRDTVCAFFTL